MKKILLVLISLVVGMVIIYHKKIKNTFFKENVYILFNTEKNAYKRPDWAKYTYLFPSDFSPEKASNIEELAKLNEMQRKQYDSIRKILYRYPQKIIMSIDDDKKEYSIALSPMKVIQYKNKSINPIEYDKVNELHFISVDSAVQITPGLEFMQISKGKKKSISYENVRFHIVEVDNKNKEAFIIKVEPVIKEYD